MSYVSLWISSSDTLSERRFARDLSVETLKDKLSFITGIPSSSQQLSLSRSTGESAAYGPASKLAFVSLLEQGTLADHMIDNGMTITVESTDPLAKAKAGQFSDLSLVEKFELTPEEYAKKSDTVLAFKQRNKLGRFSEQPAEVPAEAVDARIQPGERCQVTLSEEIQRRGTVRFVGPTEFGNKDASIWVGVEWDEPVGKSDGTVDGKTYFKAGPMRASFVRPRFVEIGDFPEIDPFEDDDLEM